MSLSKGLDSIKLPWEPYNNYFKEPAEAVELATQVLKQRPDSYEAYYARAKARIDLRLFDDALCDVQEAILLLPPQNREVRRVLLNLRDEVRAGTLTTSHDTLNQTETSL